MAAMDLSFHNHTLATFHQRRVAGKPKASTTTSRLDDRPCKKQKFVHQSSTTTCILPATASPTDFASDMTAMSYSTSTSRSSTPASTSTSSDGRRIAGRSKNPTGISSRCLKRATVLRCNRPVQASLPQDVWINIFKHSRPDFLFKARAFSPGFRDAISLDSVWKESLYREFGPDLPNPPQGLFYMQYANLLIRQGCQACDEDEQSRGKARRTYWAFQRRYCESCLTDKVIYERRLKQKLYSTSVYPYVEQMMQCLPQAKYDSWGHYQWVGDYVETPTWATKYPNGQKIGFLEPAMDELESELITYLAQEPTEDQIEAWFEPKIAANEVLVRQLQDVEDFCERRRVAKLEGTKKSKDVRKHFYQEKAASMDPPLDLGVLLQCESYKRAANIHRPAVDLERSWLTLLPKLEWERVEIEARQAKQRAERDMEWKNRERKRRRDLEEMEASFRRSMYSTAFANAGLAYTPMGLP